MKTAIFYDTETTGLPLFNEPSEEPLENAHSAMADVIGCMDVFFAIVDRDQLQDAIPA